MRKTSLSKAYLLIGRGRRRYFFIFSASYVVGFGSIGFIGNTGGNIQVPAPAIFLLQLHLLATPLLANLLLSTLGCTKKEEAKPPVIPNTGSYKLDGQLVSCQATAFEYPNRAGFYQDRLQIQPTLPSNAQGSFDNLMLSFSKNVGSPVSTYHFVGALHMTQVNSNATMLTRSYVDNLRFMSAPTAGGSCSGTFSGTSPSVSSSAGSALTEGVFTDAHP